MCVLLYMCGGVCVCVGLVYGRGYSLRNQYSVSKYVSHQLMKIMMYVKFPIHSGTAVQIWTTSKVNVWIINDSLGKNSWESFIIFFMVSRWSMVTYCALIVWNTFLSVTMSFRSIDRSTESKSIYVTSYKHWKFVRISYFN